MEDFFFELNKRFEYEGKSAIMWEKELYYLNEYKYNSNLSSEFELGFFFYQKSFNPGSITSFFAPSIEKDICKRAY